MTIGMVGIRVWVCALVFALPCVAGASTEGELEKASKAGRVALVLVTEPGANGVEKAEKVAREAVRKIGKAVLVRMDRSLPENAALVSRYRLVGPQVPLVLVFAANGMISGGMLADGLTADGLAGMVPTAKEMQVIEALQSGKGVLILAYSEGMPGERAALDACTRARDLSRGKLAVVRVDVKDGAEQPFLQRLRLDTKAGKPVTVVINSRGQATCAMEDATDPAALVEAANRAPAGGCCPGGKKSGAVCAPPAK
jgi:hypothetical protein